MTTRPFRSCALGPQVPTGTNGAISLLGTAASALGGATTGAAAYLVSRLQLDAAQPACASLVHLVTLGLAAGVVGSLVGVRSQRGKRLGSRGRKTLTSGPSACEDRVDQIDSLLGATVQVSLWSERKQKVVAKPDGTTKHMYGHCSTPHWSDHGHLTLVCRVSSVATQHGRGHSGQPHGTQKEGGTH